MIASERRRQEGCEGFRTWLVEKHQQSRLNTLRVVEKGKRTRKREAIVMHAATAESTEQSQCFELAPTPRQGKMGSGLCCGPAHCCNQKRATTENV